MVQNLAIVRDWIILADDNSIAFDFERQVLFSLLRSRASSVTCNNFTTLPLMCLAGSRDILYLLTDLPCLQTDFIDRLTMFTD